jgi:hypothetical protein
LATVLIAAGSTRVVQCFQQICQSIFAGDAGAAEHSQDSDTDEAAAAPPKDAVVVDAGVSDLDYLKSRMRRSLADDAASSGSDDEAQDAYPDEGDGHDLEEAEGEDADSSEGAGEDVDATAGAAQLTDSKSGAKGSA